MIKRSCLFWTDLKKNCVCSSERIQSLSPVNQIRALLEVSVRCYLAILHFTTCLVITDMQYKYQAGVLSM